MKNHKFIQGINLKPLNSNKINLEILFLGKAIYDAATNSNIDCESVNYAKNNLRTLKTEKTKRDTRKLIFIVVSLMVFAGIIFYLNLN